jgi:hypothetical protein
MKQAMTAFLLCTLFALGNQLRAATLPDSCGNDKSKFEVQTEKHQPAPAGPAEGKAQIVLLENENQMVAPFSDATVRFALDGTWVGADNGNSYFSIDVVPGMHHLCANWQSAFHRNMNTQLTSFTADPGKVYYFEADVTVESKETVTFGLSQLNGDQGQYKVKSSAHATGTSKN